MATLYFKKGNNLNFLIKRIENLISRIFDHETVSPFSYRTKSVFLTLTLTLRFEPKFIVFLLPLLIRKTDLFESGHIRRNCMLRDTLPQKIVKKH